MDLLCELTKLDCLETKKISKDIQLEHRYVFKGLGLFPAKQEIKDQVRIWEDWSNSS